MTELETMIRAESYIRKMADGINPITNEPAADCDMVNNVRITRCLYYVSDILRQRRGDKEKVRRLGQKGGFFHHR